MTTTTPDQGDERRAFEQWYARHMIENGFSATEQEIKDLRDGDHYGKQRVMLNGKWEGWQARAALSAAQPVAQPVVDQKPASMSDNGSCGSQVSGKPASAEAQDWKGQAQAIWGDEANAEAGKVVEVPEISSGATVDYKPTVQCTCGAEWECGQFGWEMVAGPHAPSESVAVSGEVSEDVIEALGHRKAWRYKYSSDPHHSSTYTFNRTCLIDFARAVLALAGSGKSHG